MTAPAAEPVGLSTARAIARRALRFWGAACEPALLKYRENAVFRIALPSGQPAALRVHRLGYHSDTALRSELQWTAFLRGRGISTPSPIPTADDELFVLVQDGNGAPPHQVDCLAWLEGSPLGATGLPLACTPAQAERIFAELGRAIAGIHEATSTWTMPEGFARHAWDFDGFFGDRPTWGRFEGCPLLDPECRDLVAVARAKAVAQLAACRKSAGNFGLIHADLVRENVLVRDGGVQIVDFDDCGFGWHMYDISVALYRNRDEPFYPRLEAALLSGYSGVRGLTREDIALLPLFTVLRTFALIGWVQTRVEPAEALAASALVSAHTRLMVRWYLDQQ